MKLKFYGILTAFLIIVADQFTKLWILRRIETGDIEITPFFNLVLVWNRGISFGLFGQGNPVSPIILIAISLIIAAGFGVWLWQATNKHLVIAIGAVIGGALGNVIDRLRFGAVVDFLDVHAFGWHWPAFNIADSAIVLGIAFIVLDGLFCQSKLTDDKKP